MVAGGPGGVVAGGGGGMIAGGRGGLVAGGGGMVAGGVPGGAIAGGAIAGGGASACGVTEEIAAACVCAGKKGPATMSFVGQGCGDYVTETSYKYVGWGQGNLTLVSPIRYIWGRVAALVSLIALVIVLIILLWPHRSTTTTIMTTPPPPQPHGECTFWGDPHVSGFDKSRPSFYGEGEAWVVKSMQVKIQARYKGTKYTKCLASTNAVAVGGAFLRGHVV